MNLNQNLFENKTNNGIVCVLTWAIILLQTNFFRFKYWTGDISHYFDYALFVYIVYCLIRYNAFAKKNIIYGNVVKFLMLIPLCSYFLKISAEGWGNGDVLFYLNLILSFGVYFLFSQLHASEEIIVKIIVSSALVVFFIQVFQQIRPSGVLFAEYSEDSLLRMGDYAEVRNGIYRWRLETYFITLFAMYYTWCKLLKSYSIKRLVVFVCILASMYLYMTRQVMFASVVTLALSFFLDKQRLKSWHIVLFVVGVALLYFFSDVLFGELFKYTKEESSDNIRDLTFAYYWGRDTESWITCIFGHGLSRDIDFMKENYMIVVTDVGFIGQWFIFGLIWIILYLYVVWNIVVKHRKHVPLYIRLFVIGTFINSAWIFPYRREYEFFIWSIVLYISSIYIYKSEHEYIKKSL